MASSYSTRSGSTWVSLTHFVRRPKCRRIDAEAVEGICFAFIAQRHLEPASKLVALKWAKEPLGLVDFLTFDDQAAYAEIDFLSEIAVRIFSTTAGW